MDSTLRNLIATYAKNSREVASFNAAALAVVSYDLFLSADRELELIWKSRWSTVKVLYIVCRLHGVVILTANFLAFSKIQKSMHMSVVFWMDYPMTKSGPFTQSLLVNVIELIRLNALYQRNRLFQISVAFAFIAKLVIGYVCSVFILRRTFSTLFLPYNWGIRMGGCAAAPSATPSFIVCLITLFMQFFLFALMMYKLFEAVIQKRREGSRAIFSPLFGMFFKSGAVWFASSSVAAVLFIVFYQAAEGPRQMFGVSCMVVAQTLSGTRLILNLRSSSRKDLVSTEDLDHALELLGLRDDRGVTEGRNQPDSDDLSHPVATAQASHSQDDQVGDRTSREHDQIPSSSTV